MFTEGVSCVKAGTKEFAAAVIARLGQKPNRLKPVSCADGPESLARPPDAVRGRCNSEIKGIDAFVYWPSRDAGALAASMGNLGGEGLGLDAIDNRGVRVWPAGVAEASCTDSLRCRFLAEGPTDMGRLIGLLKRIAEGGMEIAMTETLRTYEYGG